jgi:hypothetical protein
MARGFCIGSSGMGVDEGIGFPPARISQSTYFIIVPAPIPEVIKTFPSVITVTEVAG